MSSWEIFIDGQGSLTYPWLGVIVEFPTNVWYSNQTSGVACFPRRTEGFFVPVFHASSLTTLRRIFEEDLRGQGTRRGIEWETELLGEMAAAVTKLVMDVSMDGPRSEVGLELDVSRLSEVDEAWIPVKWSVGQGVLVWENSD
jgi:hypothetical protein